MHQVVRSWALTNFFVSMGVWTSSLRDQVRELDRFSRLASCTHSRRLTQSDGPLPQDSLHDDPGFHRLSQPSPLFFDQRACTHHDLHHLIGLDAHQALHWQSSLHALATTKRGGFYFQYALDAPVPSGLAIFCAQQSHDWATHNQPECSEIWAGLAATILRLFPTSLVTLQRVLLAGLLRFHSTRAPLLLALCETPLSSWIPSLFPHSLEELAQSFATGWVAIEQEKTRELGVFSAGCARHNALQAWLRRGCEPFSTLLTAPLRTDAETTMITPLVDRIHSAFAISSRLQESWGSSLGSELPPFNPRVVAALVECSKTLWIQPPSPLERHPFCLSLLALSIAAQWVQDGSLPCALWQSMAQHLLAIMEQQEMESLLAEPSTDSGQTVNCRSPFLVPPFVAPSTKSSKETKRL